MVEYGLTVDDMRQLYRAAAARDWRSPRSRALLGGPLLVLAGGLFLGLLVAPAWLFVAVPTAFWVATSWRTYLRFPPAGADELWARAIPADNVFTLSASDEAVDVRSRLSQTRYRWSAFSPADLYETEDLIVLGGPAATLAVPKRAFQTAADLATFRELIRARVGSRASNSGEPEGREP